MPVGQAQRDRCEAIRDKALELFGRPDVGDCESLAQLTEWALTEFKDVYLGSYNNDEETFVEDFTLVLTDRSEWVFTGKRTEDFDLYAQFGFAGDSCVRSVFKDGSNQVRHFWGYVALSFQIGSKFLGCCATFRELFPPEPADQALGVIGAQIGAGLDGVGFDLEELADQIRLLLCNQENCVVATGNEEEEEGED